MVMMNRRSVYRTHVFVYGALKKGGAWHHLLEGADFAGEGYTEAKYPMVVQGIPYLLDETGGYHVHGEMYAVDMDTIRALDALEQHPRWYKRLIKTVVIKGERIDAYIYFLTKECYDQIGDWKSMDHHAFYKVD